ncbi:MAG: hypothetical protein R3249_03180 [Nitriliruptorales bacterium]|nr:hypothetical protein [Nitriliruptorales bacterium]
MTSLHRLLGAAIVLALLLLAVWGVVLRLMGREQAPVAFWGAQHWLENILIVQVVTGIVLLLMGRQLTGSGLIWLHYLYGSLFPLIALVGGRLAGLRRRDAGRIEYPGLIWGALIAWGLTLRALMLGCHLPADITGLPACVLPGVFG